MDAISVEDKKGTENYEYLADLGEGAFSKVFLARHTPSKHICALKEIRLDWLDEVYYQTCVAEVTLINRICSKNVIKCFDSFFEHDFMYVALEYAGKGDLRHLINDQRKRNCIFSERTIWYYYHQICCGLKDMHEKRILHRDLKPDNIFVTDKGVIKIGDLGLARVFSENTMIAHTVVGTEYYMAPELNDASGYHFKSDIWALGCILFEMVTLRSPFCSEFENAYALHKKIREGFVFPIPSQKYSRQLHIFVNSCMAKQSKDRPSAEEAHLAARKMYITFEKLLYSYKLMN